MKSGQLFETGSGKWIELIPYNARFHSNQNNATTIINDNKDLSVNLSLLNYHNIDWLYQTIKFIPNEQGVNHEAK